MKEIKLGIENFNNIEEAYQRVLTVREMKVFERIFTNLTQIGQEVNSKFDEKIKETFMYIDECLAGWTNNKYQRFEFIRAEHALQYLNVCKSVISSSNEASKRLVELEKFIKEYSENVQTEMSEGYSFILNFKQNSLSELHEGSIFNNSDSSRILDELIEIQEDNIHKEEEKNNKIEALNFDDIRKVQANKKEKKDLSSYERRKLFTNSKTLSSRLYEVYEIQNKYPNLLELFDPEKKLFEKWKKKLNENYDEMSDQMEEFLVAKHIRDLNYNIQIARSLSQLDEFLEPKSYASLSRNFQNRFYKEAPDTLKEKIDAIKEHD